MPDIICPLFNAPDPEPLMQRLRDEGITIRHAKPWERTPLVEFIRDHFSQGWVDETLTGYARQPVSIIVAIDRDHIIGFAAYEVSGRAYFGPTGVREDYRGRGIGKALLLASLVGLREMGYTYGFIGAPGPVDFYLNAVPGLVLPAEWTTVHTVQTW